MSEMMMRMTLADIRTTDTNSNSCTTTQPVGAAELRRKKR